MKLEDLQQEWGEDSKINSSKLGAEALNVPYLHSKWMNYLNQSRLRLRKSESTYLALKGNKYKYYRGELTREELEVLGWQQYRGPRPLKGEMVEVLSMDTDLIQQQDRVEYYRTMVQFLESVIKSINSRTWDIKNGIEWLKFTNGSF